MRLKNFRPGSILVRRGGSAGTGRRMGGAGGIGCGGIGHSAMKLHVHRGLLRLKEIVAGNT